MRVLLYVILIYMISTVYLWTDLLARLRLGARLLCSYRSLFGLPTAWGSTTTSRMLRASLVCKKFPIKQIDSTDHTEQSEINGSHHPLSLKSIGLVHESAVGLIFSTLIFDFQNFESLWPITIRCTGLEDNLWWESPRNLRNDCILLAQSPRHAKLICGRTM